MWVCMVQQLNEDAAILQLSVWLKGWKDVPMQSAVEGKLQLPVGAKSSW